MKYPDAFKTSFITPIHKSGDTDNIENYRPISLLSTIAKILDKLVYNHIRRKTAHLVSVAQHGFTQGKSALTNLMEYTNYISSNMIWGGQIDSIYMDLAKAFDRIRHATLLSKLRNFPISPCLITFNRISRIGSKLFVFMEKNPNVSLPCRPCLKVQYYRLCCLHFLSTIYHNWFEPISYFLRMIWKLTIKSIISMMPSFCKGILTQL